VSAEKKRRFTAADVRLAVVGLFVVLAWLGMGYRLFHIQVLAAPDLARQGLEQRLVERELAPQRGKIFDRNGEILALTVEAQSLYAVPDQLESPLWVAQQIGGALGVDGDALYQRLTSGSSFVYIKRQVDRETAQSILDLGVKGIYAHPEPTRVYPAGVTASHVTGFVDIDGVGREGLELVYDEALTGVPGKAVFERSLDGTPILQGYSDIVPAIPGVDLYTTIDLPLQYQAQKSCADAVERTGAESCWVVALHVETGEILAMTGYPVFDPETRRTVDPACDDLEGEERSTCLAFRNFVIRGIYEPGSTQKLITVAAALEEGEVDINTVIPEVADELELKPGACEDDDDDLYGCYRDFSRHETRDMTVAEIFSQSSNIGTIKIAEKLGQRRLVQYIQAFGLGKRTGVDYTAEAAGILNFEAGCDICWASAAIGYSVAATPMQMAAAYAAVGNDGMWITPHLVAARTDVDGDIEPTPVETKQVISPTTARIMQELLAQVVAEGTGIQGSVEGYRVGGKTGTANRIGPDGRYTNETRASFVGMAPISDPQVVVAVLIDNPSREFRTGGQAAAPVFAEVMEQALHRLAVTPDHAR
jgi:cell division protein FtsI/penicillin-binding protein 2